MKGVNVFTKGTPEGILALLPPHDDMRSQQSAT